MDLDLLYILAGGLVGFTIGLTGIGGGSLMTPILVLGFGFAPAVAVGTDLLYAALTKSGGVYFHHRQKTVDWTIVSLLARGSIPSSIITIFALESLKTSGLDYEALMMTTLSLMLITTALVVFSKDHLLAILHRRFNTDSSLCKNIVYYRPRITIFSGILLGFLVTVSSVGAGAIGSAILLLLYPKKPSITIVGTDIAHAVPLTAVAGLGHLHFGSVDTILLLALLLGGFPAIYLGSLIGRNIPDRILRPIVATILLTMGVRFGFWQY